MAVVNAVGPSPATGIALHANAVLRTATRRPSYFLEESYGVALRLDVLRVDAFGYHRADD